MRKILNVCVCGLAVATLAVGCSKSATIDQTTAAETTTAADASVSQGSTAADVPSEPVDLSTIDYGTVTLGDYMGIEVEKPAVEVTDEEVEAAISAALNQNPLEVDRPVENGDVVNIDYVGTKDGVAFEGGTAKGYDLTIGAGQFIPGFEEGLIGAKKGDEVTLDLTFPEDYGKADLAGQKTQFKVTVNSVKMISELNDEFVQSVSDLKTVAEYKADLKQKLLDDKSVQADETVRSMIYQTAMDNATFDVKDEAVEANYTNMIINYTNQASMYGMDLATMASMYGMTEDSFKEQLKTMAESTVKQHLLIRAVADQEKIVIEDDERDDLATEMGYENKEAMIENAGEVMVDDYILSEKVLEYMVSNAVIK